jgi:hypothetical protein
MLDNQLLQLFLPIIKQGLIDRSATYPALANVKVKKSYQPTQTGTPSGPTVFVHKLFDFADGFTKRSDQYVAIDDKQIHTELQRYETHYQVDALVTQDPRDLNSLTASDVVNFVRQILQSSATIETLVQNEVGIYRIGEIRNPYFSDDRDQFEASPSFDFVLTHNQVYSNEVNGTNIIECDILGV